MARTTSTNFTGANSFPKANADSDPFDATDVQQLAAAVDAHDHSSGKGLTVSGGGGGGGGGYAAQSVLSATAASISVTIPTGGTDARLTFCLRGDASGTDLWTRIQLNADTGSNYGSQVQYIQGTGQTPSSLTGTYGRLGGTAGATAGSNIFGEGWLRLTDYRGSKYKTWYGQSVTPANTAGSTLYVYTNGGIWQSTAAITTVTLLADSGNLVAGSRLAVWLE